MRFPTTQTILLFALVAVIAAMPNALINGIGEGGFDLDDMDISLTARDVQLEALASALIVNMTAARRDDPIYGDDYIVSPFLPPIEPFLLAIPPPLRLHHFSSSAIC